MSTTSPTELSLKYLRGQGWLVDICERYVPSYTGMGGKRHDLFGMLDLIAVRGDETLGVQTTSNSNFNSRINKIRDDEHHQALVALRAAGWQVHVHGWCKANRKTGVVCTHGKGARCGCIYTLHRTIDLTTEDP